VSVVIILPTQPGVTELLNDSDAYMAELYPAESNHMTDLHALADPASILVGVVEEGAAVACGAMVRQRDGYAELKRMFVPERLRGNGYGKRILRALISIADSENLKLRLETGIKQPEAISLYRSHGFVEVEAFEPYAPDALSVFMEREPQGR
jgi:putative acetyltransferase